MSLTQCNLIGSPTFQPVKPEWNRPLATRLFFPSMAKNGLGVRQYVRPVFYTPRLFVVERGLGLVAIQL